MKKIEKYIIVAFLLVISEMTALDLIWKTKPHTEQINQILISRNLKNYITISNDKSLKIIDMENGNIIDSINFDYYPRKFNFSLDSSEFIISTKSKNYGAIKFYNSFDLRFNSEILLAPLLNPKIQSRNQEFIECNAVDLGNNIILTGTGIYNYINADHFYYGKLTKFNKTTSDTIRSIYNGGMVTNLKLSPDKKHIAFSTLYRSSEFYKLNVYIETERNELIICDSGFKNFHILRSNNQQNYESVDGEVFNAINFSPDSKKIVAVTDEHHILVYDVDSKELSDSIYSCDCYADMDVGFVYNSNNVVSGTNNGKVNIWNLDWDILIDNIVLDNSPYITAMACSEKYNLFAVGDYKGNLNLLTSREFSDVINPNDDLISIQQNGNYIRIINNSNIHNMKIDLYNLIGEQILSRNTQSVDFKLILDEINLLQGIYIIRVQAGNLVKTFSTLVVY